MAHEENVACLHKINMPQVTYQALQFDKGMTPKLFTPNSATRIEHFDTITEVLRPFRTLISSPHNQGGGVTIGQIGLIGFDVANDIIYGVGMDWSTGVTGAIYKWDTSGFQWTNKVSFGGTLVPTSMLQSHAGFLFGLQNSRYLYKYNIATDSIVSMTFYDTGAVFTNGFADAITHSKDGKMYFATDNKIHYVLSDGTSPTLGLTLPNANFRVTSLSEQGNYINIVGYDVKSGESSSLLWDRDTSVVDLTESYGLGRDTVIHNACLLGTTFTVQVRSDSSNSSFQEKPVIVIKWLNGAKFDTLSEFPVASISVPNLMIGAKYQSLDRFYFTAKVQFIGESAARNVCFCLDYKGRLTIAQNVDINTGTNAVSGVLRNGEAFWFGAGSDGAWNTTTTYTTISSYETNDIRATDLGMNLDFKKATLTCEPLPASGQILVKMRKNEETTFTTVATLTGTNTAKFSLTEMKVKNALVGLDKAKQVRIRLESTVGAVITGFQAIFNEVADDTI